MPARSYNALTSCIERAIAKLNIHWGQIEAHPAPRQSTLTAIASRAKKGCSPYYRLLMCRTIQSRDTRKQEEKWHQHLNGILSVNFWDQCHHFVNRIKNNNEIKYFQYQIVRGSLKTNSIVSHFVPLVRETCSFGCQQEVETIPNLFWNCPVVQTFWESLANFAETTFHITIELSNLRVLFGIHDEPTDSVQNTIILTAKKFIWRQKFIPLNPCLNLYLKYLKTHLEIVKLTWTFKNLEHIYNDQWGNIFDSLNQYLQDGPGGNQDPPP